MEHAVKSASGVKEATDGRGNDLIKINKKKNRIQSVVWIKCDSIYILVFEI